MTLEAEANIWRWALWAQGALEPWVQRDAFMAPIRERAQALLSARIASALNVLDRALADASWLAGSSFGVADLCVAAVLSPSRVSQIDLSTVPRVSNWLARCYARPAAVRTRQQHQEA
jgi:glutathione S-transferase